MKQRFRLYRRAASGRFYADDSTTGKQESLKTSDRTVALQLLSAKDEAAYHPAFNAQLARTNLAIGDSAKGGRTWRFVMDALVREKKGDPVTGKRYADAFKL